MKKKETQDGWMERLGLYRVSELTEEICWRRVRHLRRGLRIGKYAGDKLLEDHAKYYANWYAWIAKKGLDRNGESRTTTEA